MAYDSTITIEELTGSKRMLVLAGSALPKQGAPWGVALRVNTKFPAGSTRATEHVLGPTEAPSEWAGLWSSTRLARSPVRVREGGGETSTSRAVEVVKLFESFVRASQRLRVTWTQNLYTQGVPSGSEQIMRQGFCSSFLPNYARMDDVEWQATWQWGDRGEDPTPIVTTKSDDLGSAVQATLQQLQALTELINQNAIRTATTAAVGSPSTFSLGDLEALTNLPSQFFDQVANIVTLAVSGLTEIAGLFENVVMQPVEVASRAIDVAESAASSLVNVVETFTRTVPEAYSSVFDRPGLLISIVSYFDDVEEQTEKAAAACTQMATTMRAQVSRRMLQSGGKLAAQEGDILAVYIPKSFDTFTSLSVKYYGAPDYSGNIAQSNGFESYDVAPTVGKVLIIPTLKTIKQSQKQF